MNSSDFKALLSPKADGRSHSKKSSPKNNDKQESNHEDSSDNQSCQSHASNASNAARVKNALQRLQTKIEIGKESQHHVKKVVSDVQKQIDLDDQKEDRDPSNLVQQARNQRAAIKEDQEKHQLAIIHLEKKLTNTHNNPILDTASAYEQKSPSGAKAGMLGGNLFGKMLAQKVGTQALKKNLKEQRGQFELEKAAVQKVKNQLGYDLETDQFESNLIKLQLIPRPVTLHKGNTQRGKGDMTTMSRKVARNTADEEPLEMQQARLQIQQQIMIMKNEVKVERVLKAGLAGIFAKKEVESVKSEKPVEVDFQHSLLYCMLKKDVQQRTDNDLRELKHMIMNFDFIKKSELNFQASDLSDLVKHVGLQEIHPMCNLFKEGDDADRLYFVISGLLIVTYKLTSHDKMAIYLGKKDGNRNVDGLMKSYAINTAIRGCGEKAEKQKSDLSMYHGSSSQSQKSSKTGKSGKTGRSGKKHSNSAKSLKQRNNLFITQLNKQTEERVKKSAMLGGLSIPQGDTQIPKNELIELTASLGTKYGEDERMRARSSEPLNAIFYQKKRQIEEVGEKYREELQHEDHYVMRSKQQDIEAKLQSRKTMIMEKSTRRRGQVSQASVATFNRHLVTDTAPALKPYKSQPLIYDVDGSDVSNSSIYKHPSQNSDSGDPNRRITDSQAHLTSGADDAGDEISDSDDKISNSDKSGRSANVQRPKIVFGDLGMNPNLKSQKTGTEDKQSINQFLDTKSADQSKQLSNTNSKASRIIDFQQPTIVFGDLADQSKQSVQQKSGSILKKSNRNLSCDVSHQPNQSHQKSSHMSVSALTPLRSGFHQEAEASDSSQASDFVIVPLVPQVLRKNRSHSDIKNKFVTIKKLVSKEDNEVDSPKSLHTDTKQRSEPLQKQEPKQRPSSAKNNSKPTKTPSISIELLKLDSQKFRIQTNAVPIVKQPDRTSTIKSETNDRQNSAQKMQKRDENSHNLGGGGFAGLFKGALFQNKNIVNTNQSSKQVHVAQLDLTRNMTRTTEELKTDQELPFRKSLSGGNEKSFQDNSSNVQIDLDKEDGSSLSNTVTDDNVSDSSDDEYLDNILDELVDIGKDEKGKLDEIPLFNIPKGRYFGASNLLLADQDLYRNEKWHVSCYSRRKKTFVITIPRDKYKRACDNARNRVKQEKIEFLKQVEIIKLFQRNSIKNFIKYLVQRNVNRGQQLFKEGDRAEKVYIVINGQFKVSKQIVTQNSQMDDKMQIGEKGRIESQTKQNNLKTQNQLKIVQLELQFVVNKGILGEEDAFRDSRVENRHVTTCTCVSETAEVYEIKQEDFIRDCKKQPSFSTIIDQIKAKRSKYASRIVKKDEVQVFLAKHLKKGAKNIVIKKKKKNVKHLIDQNKNLKAIEQQNAHKQQMLKLSTMEKEIGVPTGSTKVSTLNLQTLLQPASLESQSVQNQDHQRVAQLTQRLPPMNLDQKLMETNQLSKTQSSNQLSQLNTFQKAYLTQRAPLNPDGKSKIQMLQPSNSVLINNPESRTLFSRQQQPTSIVSSILTKSSTVGAMMQSKPFTYDKPNMTIKVPSRQQSASINNLETQASARNTQRTLYRTQSAATHYEPPTNQYNPQTTNLSSASKTKDERFKIDLNKVTRFRPDDLKYKSQRTFSLNMGLHEDTQKSVGFGLHQNKTALKEGQLNCQGNFRQSTMKSSNYMDQESKLAHRKHTFEMIKQFDLAMKQYQQCKKQNKKLMINVKQKDGTQQGLNQGNTKAQGGKDAKPQEVTRAGFLLKQSQQKARQAGQPDHAGSYGYMTKRYDDKVEGASVLVHKLITKLHGQEPVFGKKQFSKKHFAQVQPAQPRNLSGALSQYKLEQQQYNTLRDYDRRCDEIADASYIASLPKKKKMSTLKANRHRH